MVVHAPRFLHSNRQDAKARLRLLRVGPTDNGPCHTMTDPPVASLILCWENIHYLTHEQERERDRRQDHPHDVEAQTKGSDRGRRERDVPGAEKGAPGHFRKNV
jgi:hypothetical protein